MFEKSLTDLIRGIRANKKNEQKYIAACLQEIRNEVKSNDLDIKSIAVAKLTYLHMLGYDMSWASFHMIEVMSSAKFLHKRTGYLAATLSFQQDTDVLMLTTNLIKKDLASPAPIDIGIALNGLSHIVTPDLARDLCPDLVSMLNHSRPYIRKKVVLVLYKVFLKYPEALRLSFPRLKEKLEDPDPSVVSAVISVVCELARKNPKNYLSLAPQLFKLLTTSSNNWMLIKIIKLFASLTPLEPRLIKKLLPPLASLIQTTLAMSLLYECIYTVITGGFLEAAGDSGNALAATCTNKLRKFLEDPDQNLKYVGLLAMSKLLVTHPKLVSEHKDLILECIDDEDISIRLRSLDLVVGMVNRKNVVEIVKRLITHIMPKSSPESSLHDPSTIFDPVYRTDIINRIIFICSQNHYNHINDFEWYITVLVGITYAAGVNVGDALTNQLMDVSVRVKSVREFSVSQMYNLLQDKRFLETAKKRDSNIEVLSAAAWICGEYCNYLQDIPSTLECLLTPQVTKLPVKVQTIYVHSVIKIYAYWTSELTSQWNPELQREFIKVTNVMYEKMDMFTHSTDLEVQERAYDVKSLFKIILDSVDNPTVDANEVPLVLEGLPDLFFIYELNPVAPKAQTKVPIPEGLDLDAWINDPLPDLVQDFDSDVSAADSPIGKYEKVSKSGKKKKSKSKSKYSSEEDEDKEQRRAARKEARQNDPYYIGSDKKKQMFEFEDDVDSIPVVELDVDEINLQASKLKKNAKKSKRAKKEVKTPIYAEEEMPENAAQSEDEKTIKDKKTGIIYTKKSTRDIFESNEESGLNSVDLSTPLGKDETFQQVKAYLSPEEVRMNEEIRYRNERKELRALQKKNKELLESKKKSSKEKNVPESSAPEKKKKKKSSTKKSSKRKEVAPTEEEELAKADFAVIADDVRDALAEKHEESKCHKAIEVFRDDHVSLMCNLLLNTTNPSIVDLHFTIENKDNEHMLPSLRMEFAESFDMKSVENNEETTNIASATETFELQTNEKVECVAHFEVLGNVRQGLCLRGDLFYDIEGSSAVNQSSLEIAIPVSLFLNDKRPMDPAEFATLLSEHGDDFEYHGNVSLEVPLSSDDSIEQALINALETVTRTSGLLVVEVVPGAASLYGKSVQGVQVAGLLKYTLSMESEPKVATLSIDLKSTEDDLLNGLIYELSNLKLTN
ncbi:adaptin N terminal region-domain-containing protein [Helicostylum pulchrum]|uniref:AP-3 complex subunit delta domain-containing protein n=1 Tax=Helicostylum pulchrum TaxID=562976 RepID=A0ABP9YFE9_9FUNG|nr:adaptin N terminal region-domain-containing protein [Helicostylum pulchrum]